MHCLRSKASTLSHVTPIEFETVITEVEQFLTDRESEADAWAAVGSYVRYLAGKPDKMFLELLVTPPAETTHVNRLPRDPARRRAILLGNPTPLRATGAIGHRAGTAPRAGL